MGLAPIARLRSPHNGLTMELHSSEPGVQFYDAAKLVCPVPGLDGAHYGAHAGALPRAAALPRFAQPPPFQPEPPRAGREYRHVSEFRFG